MKNKGLNNKLELLQQIQQVEAPPFLFTRIQQKIEAGSVSSKFSPKLTLSLIASFILLIVLNVTTLVKSSGEAKSEENIVEATSIIPNNYLYQ